MATAAATRPDLHNLALVAAHPGGSHIRQQTATHKRDRAAVKLALPASSEPSRPQRRRIGRDAH